MKALVIWECEISDPNGYDEILCLYFSTRLSANQLDHRTAELFIQDFWLGRFSKSFSYKAIINGIASFAMRVMVRPRF